MLYLTKEPGVKENLKTVIENQYTLQLIGGPIFHKFRSPDFDDHSISKANDKRRQGGIH